MSETILSEDELDFLMNGACFLGSGGGGRLKMAEKVRDTLYGLPPVTMVDMQDVPDDAKLCFVAGVGAPSSTEIFLNSPVSCFETLEQESGKDFQYVIPGETGAMNSLLPLLVAAQSKGEVSVVNADGAGRALPQLQMCTYALSGVSCNPAVIANEKKDTVVLRENTPEALDREVRTIITDPTKDFTGAAMLASFVMTGKQVKRDGCYVDSALQVAIDVGKALKLPDKKRIGEIMRIFELIGRRVVILEEGIVTCVSSEKQDGFDVGRVIIVDKGMPFGCFFEIDFVNENLAVRQHLANNVYPMMAPMMFCYLTKDGFPLSNADLADRWKTGELNIPIVLVGITPAKAINTEKEWAYFSLLYEKYFGKPQFEYHREPDWNVMIADAARLGCGLRFARA